MINKKIVEFPDNLEQIETSEANGGKADELPAEVWHNGNHWIEEDKLDGFVAMLRDVEEIEQ
jgi:hypothetical protein